MANCQRPPHIEKYIFPLKNIDSSNVDTFTEKNRELWDQRLKDARQKQGSHPHPKLQQPLSYDDAKGIIVLDCHNVFDSDLESFIWQCSKWNAEGFRVHVCSFVGKGSLNHASLLGLFEDIDIQRVVSTLIVVFDRHHLEMGKGVIIKQFLGSNPEIPIYFADDGIENLKNVSEVNNLSESPNLHLIHYVAVPRTQKYQTPPYAKRIGSFEDLVSYIHL